MEWREPSAVGHSEAYLEARRWIEAVTEKRFGTSDFRSALENGVLLCDLINKIKPGTIKRVNTLPTPIAGLDNLNVFLKACGKLGLKEAQLFHPGDLQDLSTRVTVKLQETNRRLKNVLITIYWLGRRAQCDHVFDGPYLNFKAFEGLLGTALYKALQETSSQKGSNVRDSGFGDSWCSEREELCHLRGHGGGGGGHKRDDSLDSLDSLGSRPHSISSDTTLKGSSEGCCSDTEADSGFRMADNKDTVSYRRSISITPKSSTHFNQFLPSKDKPLVYVPAPLRRRRAERYEDNRRSWANTTHAEDEGALTSSSSATNSRELQNAERSSGRTDRNRLVSTDSLFRETHDDSEDEDSDVGYADPVQDDLYARKMGVKAQPASNESFDKYLPKCWTPEEEAHIEKIKLGSQRRPWYKKMQGFSQKRSGSSSDDSDCDISPWLPSAHSPSGTSHSHSHSHEAMAHTTLVVGKRQQQMQESLDGSKSASDILVDPDVIRKVRHEELQKYHEQVKQSDDKWQDDLSKWKNRRRSVNSDIVKKKEEREKIEEITHSSSNRRSRTFKEMQEERENKGGRNSFSYLDDDIFQKPDEAPRSRTLPARQHTIDTPYYYSEPPEPSPKEDKPPAAFQATSRVASPPTSQEANTVDGPAGSDATTSITPTNSFQRSASPAAVPSQRNPYSDYTSSAKTKENTAILSSSGSVQKAPESRRPLSGTQVAVEAPSSVPLYKQPQLRSMEPKPPGVSRVSASLPRSYQRSDGARITSVVTARPFGTQASRIISLPRPLTMDDSHKRVNGENNVSNKSSVPSRYHQFMTSEDEAQCSSEDEEKEEEEEEEKGKTTAQSITSAQSVSSVPPPVKNEATVIPAPAKDPSQENYCEMRISLNQKPNSSRDFGFQATWDSTGARVTSIQPGSQAEMCQLHLGDEVLTVNRHQVAEMSYTDWKTSMAQALQEGSLVMDIRRHGKNSSTDTNTVSSSCLDLTSRISRETLPSKESPAHPVIDVASNGVNGGLREEPATLRSKEPVQSESISLKNLKRRSEFFEQGGSEPAMPDIPVPSITPSASRWSWDPEEERKRQEKWQKEQERLLQEKYKRDQEKLQEEWLKAQQEITESAEQQESGILEVNSHRLSPRSPLSPLNQLTPSPWEEEERKRKEEQEQELQRLAEERRKRQEEEEELRCLLEERKRKEREEEEERKRKELQEEEERKRRERQEEEEERKRKEWQEEERKAREEEELRWQKRREQERRLQEEAELQRREQERALELQQWTGGSHGFANVQPALSLSDRTKSKSSPQLDEEEKPQWRGGHVQPGGMAHWLLEEQLRSSRDKQTQNQRAASELEKERRNILNAMRYREPERVTGRGTGEKWGQQSVSQAEAERQQILNEMKKKTSLLTDSSWIRQRSSSSAAAIKASDVPPMRRGESLDNLDSYNSWRSSWTPRSNPYVQNFTRPHSALSGSTSSYGVGSAAQQPDSPTLPSSYSTGSLRGGAGTPSSPWSRQSTSPSLSSPSPIPSPEPKADALQERSSVSTASLISEDRKRGLRSEYETSSSTVTPATCDSKLVCQPQCDTTVLQQIDEETTSDNNP